MATKHIHLYFNDANEGGKSAREAASILGHFGGMARAAVLAPGRRKQIAKKAAQIRWRKHKPQQGKSVEATNK